MMHPQQNIPQQQNILKTKKKLKPGLIAFYDLLPGNKTDLFSKK